MKWRNARRSGNVVDRRGGRSGSGGGFGKLGIGGVIAVVLISLLLGQNPLQMLGLVNQVSNPPGALPDTPGAPLAADDEEAQFVASILGDTEDVWGELFRQSGETYPQPRLVLFSSSVASACGSASSAMGPFYCPGDQQVYIDLGFFEDMRTRLGGGGDFAEAYVIAHEVGHHVQTVLGVSQQVDRARAAGENLQGPDGLLVRQELQADCYAGLWAHHAQARHQWLEPGDLEEALNTASAIGDDRLQRQSQGTVVPDAFTHGSSAQRVAWFRNGFDSGDPAACDTFSARSLSP